MGCNGNLLLDRLSAAKIILIPPLSGDGKIDYGKEMFRARGLMEDYAEKLKLVYRLYTFN